MDLGWKVLVPITLGYLFVVAAAMLILQEVF
jgi:NADH:ubiquinone oxidoreductase subunit H